MPVKSLPCVLEPANLPPDLHEDYLDLLTEILRPGQHILHVGCQDGDLTYSLCYQVAEHGSVVGINAPGQDIKLAEDNPRRKAYHNASFLHVPDLTKLPFKNDTFDIVYACNIMAYLPPCFDHKTVLDFLKEMKRVAKPGGFVVSRDIGTQHFFPIEDLDALFMKTLLRAAGLYGWYGPLMPKLYKFAGYDIADPSTFTVTTTNSMRGPAMGDDHWAEEFVKKFASGTERRKQWMTVGIQESFIDLFAEKLKRWDTLTHSWYVCMYTEITAQV
ncbi:S-adenosyl-L-methionine-dependent methyltransferase [Nemania sp. NC0429]|nr:S-adenosyl-L-methionine-dependent methyltransferase [Nemania sp. NC0429]